MAKETERPGGDGLMTSESNTFWNVILTRAERIEGTDQIEINELINIPKRRCQRDGGGGLCVHVCDFVVCTAKWLQCFEL